MDDNYQPSESEIERYSELCCDLKARIVAENKAKAAKEHAEWNEHSEKLERWLRAEKETMPLGSIVIQDK